MFALEKLFHSIESYSLDQLDIELIFYCYFKPLSNSFQQHFKEQVKKQRELQKRKCKSIFFARKAEQRLLKRKVPKAVSKVVQKSPNIGRDIEEFLRLRKVGADAWRRTGVLTFDGNAKTGPKVTYKRIGLATKIRIFVGIFRA